MKSVLCSLTEAEYETVQRAAVSSATPVPDFLVRCALQAAATREPAQPYVFAGLSLSTDAFPDAWYEASEESDLIVCLKDTLRRRDLRTAAAMAIELLEFPRDWPSLARAEQRTNWARDSATDRELVEALLALAPAARLLPDATAWDCYKQILAEVCRERADIRDDRRAARPLAR